MAKDKIKAVYLDHSTLNNAVGKAGEVLDTSRYGRVIQEAIRTGVAEVWASPAHVIETLLYADFDADSHIVDNEKLDSRQHLAACLLDLIEARRMMPSRDVLVTNDFIGFMRKTAASSIITTSYFESRRAVGHQLCLEFLGSLAAYRNFSVQGPVLEEIVRVKLMTKLRYVRFVLDPNGAIERMSMPSYESSAQWWLEYDDMPLADIRVEISQGIEEFEKPKKHVVGKLQTHKKGLALRLAGDEVIQSLFGALGNGLEILATFDSEEIVKARAAFEEQLGALDVFDAQDIAVSQSSIEQTLQFVTALARRSAEKTALTAHLMNQLLLDELENSLSSGKISEASVTFDADHIACLPHVDVYVTSDGRMERIARKLVKEIRKRTGRNVIVAGSPEQLKRALKK